jgi:hypothetical protein
MNINHAHVLKLFSNNLRNRWPIKSFQQLQVLNCVHCVFKTDNKNKHSSMFPNDIPGLQNDCQLLPRK